MQAPLMAAALSEEGAVTADTDRARMTLKTFKPIVKGALRGFATVQLPIGIVIADVPICTSHGKTWASLPSKPILDADGRHAEEGGKRKYAPILRWANRATADRWSQAVVDLVRQHHPDAMDDGGAP
jgi:hypothetical protein